MNQLNFIKLNVLDKTQYKNVCSKIKFIENLSCRLKYNYKHKLTKNIIFNEKKTFLYLIRSDKNDWGI